MQTYIDSNSPRHRLPFTELPRGHVRFPEHIVQGSRTWPANMAMERITRDRALSGTRWPGSMRDCRLLTARCRTASRSWPLASRRWVGTAENRRPASKSLNPHEPTSEAYQ